MFSVIRDNLARSRGYADAFAHEFGKAIETVSSTALSSMSTSLLVLALLPAAASLALSQCAAPAVRAVHRAPRMEAIVVERIVELDESNFAETIASNKGLAVVMFYAPFCRTCRTLKPLYERSVSQLESEEAFSDVTFYRVNFKDNKQLAHRERIAVLPTFHFYAPFASRRINRFVPKPMNFRQEMRRELERYVGDSGHLSLLQTLSNKPAPLSALTRYGYLTGFLTALSNVDGYLTGALFPEGSPKAEIASDVVTDERRLKDLAELFAWVDANGDGVISANELAAVAKAVGTLGAGAGADETVPLDTFFAGLLQYAQESAGGCGGDAGPCEAGETPSFGVGSELDFDAFVRLMSCKAVAEYGAPDDELQPVFEALDANQDGVISRAELVHAMDGVRANLATTRADAALISAQDVEDAFEAADRDRTGTISYEEFVAIMSDMTVAPMTAAG